MFLESHFKCSFSKRGSIVVIVVSSIINHSDNKTDEISLKNIDDTALTYSISLFLYAKVSKKNDITKFIFLEKRPFLPQKFLEKWKFFIY